MADSGSLALLPPAPTPQPIQSSTDQSGSKTKSTSDSSFGHELEKAKKHKAASEKKPAAVAAPPAPKVADKNVTKTAAAKPADKPAPTPEESTPPEEAVAAEAEEADQPPIVQDKPAIPVKPKTVATAKDPAEAVDSGEAEGKQSLPKTVVVQPADPNETATEKPVKTAKLQKIAKAQPAAAEKPAPVTAAPAPAKNQPAASDADQPAPVVAKSKVESVKAKVVATDSDNSSAADSKRDAIAAITVSTTATTTPDSTATAAAVAPDSAAPPKPVPDVTAFGTTQVTVRVGGSQLNAAQSTNGTSTANGQASSAASEVADDAADDAADAATVDDVDAADATPAKPLPHVDLTTAGDPAGTGLPHLSSTASVAAKSSAAVTTTPQARFTEDNHPSMVSGIQGQLLPQGGTMQLQLHPAELGALQVTVHVQDGVVTASFETSNDHATRLLSHSLGDLKAGLEAAGVTVEKLHVEQAPKQQDAKSNSDSDSRQTAQDHQSRGKQDQQRREMVQRMWRKLAGAGDPLDMVA